MNQMLKLVVILVFGFSNLNQTLAGDLSAVEVARKSVVSVMPQWQGRPPNAAQPEGSGVVIGDGKLVVSAAHVIGIVRQVANDILVRDEDGNRQLATVLVYNTKTDLALLSLQTALPPVKWAVDEPIAGEDVCAIGNAFGLGLSVTCGHVSAMHKAGVGFNPIEDFIQTDSAVNPGMSGGALINQKGELVGILSAIFTKQTDANIGVNFAVSGELVRQFVAAVQQTSAFVPFNPGLAVRAVPDKGMAGREGIEVLQAFSGLPGQKAGVKAGDIIFQAAGRRIRSKADWVSVLAGATAVNSISMSGERQGRPLAWKLGREQSSQ